MLRFKFVAALESLAKLNESGFLACFEHLDKANHLVASLLLNEQQVLKLLLALNILLLFPLVFLFYDSKRRLSFYLLLFNVN